MLYILRNLREVENVVSGEILVTQFLEISKCETVGVSVEQRLAIPTFYSLV